jgi:hypothetical protein
MGRECSANGVKNIYIYMCVCVLLVGKPEGMRPLVRPRGRWHSDIKKILERWDGFIWMRMGPVEGSCECNSEFSSSVKCRRFLDQLHN